jgi:uncharacterized membrane protein YebE (DUF533 family)
MEQSKQFSLNLRDAINGLVVAVGGAVVSVLQTSFTSGSFTINWTQLGSVALAAGLAYIGKNYFSKPTETTAPSK